MKNRGNVFSIVRWKHRNGTLSVSWPLLHYVSLYARIAIVCILVCPPLALAALAYVQHKPYSQLIERATSSSPPSWLVIVITISLVVAFLDFVLRNQLRISPQEVVFRRPWGSVRTWPRNRLAGVQCELHQIEATSDTGPTTIGIVQLILCDDDGVRERLEVGGSLHQGIAEELVGQIGHYTRIW